MNDLSKLCLIRVSNCSPQKLLETHPFLSNWHIPQCELCNPPWIQKILAVLKATGEWRSWNGECQVKTFVRSFKSLGNWTNWWASFQCWINEGGGLC